MREYTVDCTCGTKLAAVIHLIKGGRNEVLKSRCPNCRATHFAKDQHTTIEGHVRILTLGTMWSQVKLSL